MSRYALFTATEFYPLGGWDDLEAIYYTIEAAKQAAATSDWAQIVDLDTAQIVATGGRRGHGYGPRGKLTWDTA